MWSPGADTVQGPAFLDVDDTIREVHGYAKQGAAYGYTRVRGLNIQLATVSTALAAPVIARAWLRKGNPTASGYYTVYSWRCRANGAYFDMSVDINEIVRLRARAHLVLGRLPWLIRVA